MRAFSFGVGLGSSSQPSLSVPPSGDAEPGDIIAPTITSDNPSGTFAEGEAVGGTLTADETVTWLKSGADASRVTLNASTGVWSLPTTDYETKTSYSWTFTARDLAGNIKTQNVAITITDIDELAPTITSDNPSATFAEGATVGGTLTANETVTWAKSGTDAASVTLNTSTGVWSLAATDYETKTSYSWTFTATDAAGNAATQNITIAISDVDEVAPTITSGNPTGSFAEGAPVGGTLTANETVTWAKSGTDAASVTLNASTGVWSLAATDYETKTSYSWTFSATDTAGNTTTQNVAITITDIDEIAPSITSSAAVSIAEGSVLAHSLTANESVSWSLVGGVDQARFELSGSTLRWLANGIKDREQPDDTDANNTYIVQVRAADVAGNASLQTLTVTVSDVDEVPDDFTFIDTNDAAPTTEYISNTITLAGLASGVSVPVTVTAGEFSKNGGAYTTSAGTAQNGDTFTVRHNSSGSYSTATNTTLTIGGVSDTFTTTTAAAPALIASPNPANQNTAWAVDTNVFSVLGVPEGVTPTISPADNRLVIYGNSSDGWWVRVGSTAAIEGEFTYTVSATGTTPIAVPVTVSSVAAPAFSENPSISPSSANAGALLTGADGTYSGGTVDSRQWLLDGEPISGATGSTFTANVAGAYTFRVLISGAGGTTAATSASALIASAGVPDLTVTMALQDQTGAKQEYLGWGPEIQNYGQTIDGDATITNYGSLYNLKDGTDGGGVNWRRKLSKEIYGRGFGAYELRSAEGLWSHTGFSNDGLTLDQPANGNVVTASTAKRQCDAFPGQTPLAADLLGGAGMSVQLEWWGFPPFYSTGAGLVNPVRKRWMRSDLTTTDYNEIYDNVILHHKDDWENCGISVTGFGHTNEYDNNQVTVATAWLSDEQYKASCDVWWPRIVEDFDNVTAIYQNSWDGIGGVGALIRADSALRSIQTGLPHSADTIHSITNTGLNPNVVKTNSNGKYTTAGLPVESNEFWVTRTDITPEERFCITAIQALNFIIYRGAKRWSVIHGIKPLGQTANYGYCPTVTRMVGDTTNYGQMTGYDQNYDHCPQGEYVVMPPIAHMIFAMLDAVPRGSTIYDVTPKTDYTGESSVRVMGWKTPTNKWGYLILNWRSTSTRVVVGSQSGTSRTFNAALYNTSVAKQAMAQHTGVTQTVDIPAYAIVTLLEEGYDTYPQTPEFTVSWRSGFAGGNIPEATAPGTVLADLVPTGGTGHTFTKETCPINTPSWAAYYDPNNRISLVGTTLVLGGALNFEGGTTNYTGTFRVTNTSERWTQERVKITVVNSNEAPTNISLTNSTVGSDKTEGAVIGLLSTTDVDAGDTFTYTFGAGGTFGSAGGKVKISGAQLQVGAASPLTEGTFQVTVVATDAGGLSTSKDFTITVTAAVDSGAPLVVTLPIVPSF